MLLFFYRLYPTFITHHACDCKGKDILWTDIACLCKISSTQALYCRHLLVKYEDNGERILYVDGQERSIVKLVSWANVEVIDFTQCSHNWKPSRWCYLSNVLMKLIVAVHHTREHTRGNIRLVWRKFYTSKRHQFKVCPFLCSHMHGVQ